MERLDEKNISIFSLLKYEKFKIFIGVLLGIFSGVLSFTPFVILYQMILSLIGTKYFDVGNNDMYSCRSLQHNAPFKNGSIGISIKSKFGIFQQ